MIYVLTIIVCTFVGMMIPKVCLSLVLTKQEKTVQNINLYKNTINTMSVIGIFFLSAVFCFITYLKQQEYLLQEKCENHQGVYLAVKGQYVCISRKSYDEYLNTLYNLYYEYNIEAKKSYNEHNNNVKKLNQEYYLETEKAFNKYLNNSIPIQ